MSIGRFLVIAAILLGVAALGVTPSLAAKGGKGRSPDPAPTTSSIVLNEDDPHLGGTVTFKTNAVGLAGWEWPMVGVLCYQNGELVYAALDQPDAAFLLGGGWSRWLETGGDADCTANVYAYGSRGGEMSSRVLASTFFRATGS